MAKDKVVTANGVEPTIVAVDPFTGATVDALIGAEPHPMDSWEPDSVARGDDVTAQPIAAPPTPPETPPEEPSGEVAQDEAAAAEAAAAEAAAAEAAAAEAAKSTRSKTIPRERFDEVNAKFKALQAENEALKAGKTTPATPATPATTFDFVTAQKEYASLLLDGRIDEATQKFAEIQQAVQDDTLAKAAAIASNTIAATKTKESVDTVTAEATATYDVFDEDSENFRADLVDDVEAQYIGYQDRGMDPVAALKKAIDNVVKLNGLGQPATPTPTPPTPKVNVDKKLKEAAGTPPVIAKTGVGAVVIGASNPDVRTISDEEYDALPHATRMRLRGDTL